MSEGRVGWYGRTPFERMMDEIATAASVAEADHLRSEIAAAFADHPRRDELELMLDAKRRALAKESKP